MFRSSVEKFFFYFGLKPRLSQFNRFKALKWTLIHLIFCVFLATFLLYHRDCIVSQLNDLGYAADHLKLISLFGFLIIHFSEVLWKASNHDVIDEILAETDKILTGIGIKMDLVQRKAHKRFTTFFLSFGVFYIVCEIWVIATNYQQKQARRFFFAFIYPQVMKYLSISFFIYYLTIVVIYLEAIHKEISISHTKNKKDSCHIIQNLERAYRKLETLSDVLMNTFELSLMAYIFQDSYHLFADLYWLIFKLINTKEVLYWPVFVPKLFIKFALFYGGQLCIDLVSCFIGDEWQSDTNILCNSEQTSVDQDATNGVSSL